jgi:hypothetical protein
MLNDELADLEIFAAVADARSFTRAAAAAFHGAGLAIVMVAPFIATNSTSDAMAAAAWQSTLR